MTMQLTLGGQPVQDAIAQAANLAKLGYPPPPDFARANSLLNPLGESPARGWFLLLREDLNQLDLNSLLTLTLADDLGNSGSIKGLVVAREPTCLTPSGNATDAGACYLVEVADARWRCHNPYYSLTVKKQYNVRAPGWGGEYYASSLNGGAPWSWSQMLGDLWALLSAQLGAYPGLPAGFTPDGIPERFQFLGVSAWRALCQVLKKLGLAVAWQAFSGTYTIVQIGAADNAAVQVQNAAASRLIFDRQFAAVVRGRVPAAVRVHFHRVQEHYGTEPATAEDATQFVTSNVYTVDVAGTAAQITGAEAGTYHPLWDDLPALYDPLGNLLNLTALQTRAQNRASAYYAMLTGTGGTRRQQIYAGLVKASPGSTLRGVCWRQDLQSLGDAPGEGGGLLTEIVTWPTMQVRVSEQGQFEEELADSSALHPPDLRVKEPLWPDLCQMVRITSETAEIPQQRVITDGVLTLDANTLGSASGNFSTADQGLSLRAVGIPAGTTIATVTSGTLLQMSQVASVNATNVSVTIGSAIGGLPALVQVFNSDTGLWIDREACKVVSLNAEPINTERMLARLIGFDGTVPLYAPDRSLGWVRVTSSIASTIFLGREVSDGQLTGGQNTLFAPFGNFTNADVGLIVIGTGILQERMVTDGVLNQTNVFSSATGNFTNADVGAPLTAVGIPAGTTIQSVTNGTTVVMTASATVNATSVPVTIGTWTTIQSVTDASHAVLSQNASTNGTNVAVLIASGQSQAFAATLDLWNPSSGTWSDTFAVWFEGVNGETPIAGWRYQCRPLGFDAARKGIWAAASFADLNDGYVTLSAIPHTPRTIYLTSGATTQGYAGTFSNRLTSGPCWLVGELNGLFTVAAYPNAGGWTPPYAGWVYQARFSGNFDKAGVPIFEIALGQLAGWQDNGGGVYTAYAGLLNTGASSQNIPGTKTIIGNLFVGSPASGTTAGIPGNIYCEVLFAEGPAKDGGTNQGTGAGGYYGLLTTVYASGNIELGVGYPVGTQKGLIAFSTNGQFPTGAPASGPLFSLLPDAQFVTFAAQWSGTGPPTALMVGDKDILFYGSTGQPAIFITTAGLWIEATTGSTAEGDQIISGLTTAIGSGQLPSGGQGGFAVDGGSFW